MTAMMPARPGRLLAARRPLTRHPPAPYLLRPRRIVEVEDHHDVADVAIHLGRDVGGPAIEAEAVDPSAAALPEGDLARSLRLSDVVDDEPAGHPGRRLLRGLRLAVHQHEAGDRTHPLAVR